MRWKKMGFIYKASQQKSWMDAYAQMPRAVEYPGFLRIYYTTRSPKDGNGQFISRIGYIDVQKDYPARVLSVSLKPSLDTGGLGAFDQHGVMPGFPMRHNGRFLMYYTGWSRRIGVPYSTSIGLCESFDEGHTFERVHAGPVMAQTWNEPFSVNGPFILDVKGILHMWYASVISWFERKVSTECQYVIMHATSKDGVLWNRDGKICIPLRFKDECQCVPGVVKIGDMYHMWFSYRHAYDFRNPKRGYRMGFAYSNDLLTWHRDDSKAGIDLSNSGWDSEMQSYPHVFEIQEKTYMFYCGNYFGRDGFGYAELECRKNILEEYIGKVF